MYRSVMVCGECGGVWWNKKGVAQCAVEWHGVA